MAETTPTRRRDGSTNIHVTALDAIANANSLFTFAVSVGLTLKPTDTGDHLITNTTCSASSAIGEGLVTYHVCAFSCFLFSSLIAYSLKQIIKTEVFIETHRFALARVNKRLFQLGMMLSAAGSAFGYVFLMLALVDVVQIKMGTLACRSFYSFAAVVPLLTLGSVALLAYIFIVLYAFIKLGTLACGSSQSLAAVVPLVILVPLALLWIEKLSMHSSLDMDAQMKYICILGFLVLVSIAGFERANGAGECGKSSPDREAWKLAPCVQAAQDESAEVSDSCCAQVKKIGQNPRCLCAVMLSNTAKMSGANPEIAVTIPKRCNIADRPVGYICGCGRACGSYTLP
ncbi:Bifunctional inhibitor/plant lipid transfer protein/seed storage helical domain [Dillenia turbinata]|uniref:Bifunctional inhibitor/plant lipid transfer protein/seed storage helical domain n=1 Tax=Dillenia turbinata TaxID=194707 RepID=A0AAN8VNY4_9MAGN